jgi:hypothetical protein
MGGCGGEDERWRMGLGGKERPPIRLTAYVERGSFDTPSSVKPAFCRVGIVSCNLRRA